MNLIQLRAFDAVIRTGSITGAAENLHVSQPAITNHIKSLEAYYEVSLLRRRGRGVVPTELGIALSGIARELFGLEEQAVDLLMAHRHLESGTLRLAADGPYILVPLVAAFQARYPGVRIEVEIANTEQVEAALREERCDVSVLARNVDPDHFTSVTLTSYSIIVFVSPDHEWAVDGRQQVKLGDLDGRAMIIREPGSTTRRVFEEACKARGIEPVFMIETTSRETVKEAVAAGLGIGVISEAELRPDPRFVPIRIEDAALEYTEQVICLTRRRGLSAIREFLRIAGEIDDAGTFPDRLVAA